MQSSVLLFPQRICETMAGNLAHTIGRIALKPGRPMLVEHVGGLYLKHDLAGRVLTTGFGPEYDITYVRNEDVQNEEQVAALTVSKRYKKWNR